MPDNTDKENGMTEVTDKNGKRYKVVLVPTGTRLLEMDGAVISDDPYYADLDARYPMLWESECEDCGELAQSSNAVGTPLCDACFAARMTT